MNSESTILLIGVGGAGSAMAKGVRRAFGDDLRYLLADTDATTGRDGDPFVLLGGGRLAGRGAGGDTVAARLSAEESSSSLDQHIEGVRLAVVVTALGGGTGGGATIEIVKHLDALGIPVVVFATTPFTFEGEDRLRNARGVMSLIAEFAASTFFMPLNDLVADEDNMAEALRRAVDTLAAAVTLFWRLVGKPGYIRLDVERLRKLVKEAGRGRFAVATAQGEHRADEIVVSLTHSPFLAFGSSPVRSILCGILAGDDLRLSEVGKIAGGLQTAFGDKSAFELATVNDEATFSGKISVVALLFESGSSSRSEVPQSPFALAVEERKPQPTRTPRRAVKNPLSQGPQGRGRFNNVAPTIWHGTDLDTPTYLRQGITLEF